MYDTEFAFHHSFSARSRHGPASMSPETVLYHVVDGVAEIRLNRPQRLNAVIQQLYDELNTALDCAAADRAVRAIVLTGEGRAFCVGADLKAHQAGRSAFDRRQYLKGEQDVCARIVRLNKPVIAAVNGYALGAGAELALAADFLLIAEGAEIGFPELSMGNFLGGGITWLLPRLVGLAKARELIFIGERIGAAEAVRIGLASRALPAEGFIEAAHQFAHRLARNAPLSMELAKEQLNLSAERTFDACLRAELEGMMFAGTTRDWQEGIDAFAEKRPPQFRGE